MIKKKGKSLLFKINNVLGVLTYITAVLHYQHRNKLYSMNLDELLTENKLCKSLDSKTNI